MAVDQQLAEEALSHAAISEAKELAKVPALGRTLTRLLAEGVSAWPAVKLAPEAFARDIARHVRRTADPTAALSSLHASDLYLASACVHGDARALGAFDRHFLSQVAQFITHVGTDPAFVAEVAQGLRAKLLLASGESAPKIADYTGRGPLGGWLRIAAVRTALNMRRDARAPEGIVHGLEHDAVAPDGDPELQLLRAKYREEFRDAFAATLAGLSSDERNILRSHHIDGLTLDQLSALYRTPRSTVARWVAAARRRIFLETRKRLAEQLRAEPAELESILRAVRSQLDVSIQRYLE